MNTYSFGYPPDDSKSAQANFTVSKGTLLNFWLYKTYKKNCKKLNKILKYKFDKDPILLLVSNYIISGNSGGPIVDAEGKLMGVVFCNLSLGGGEVINEIGMAINVNLVSRFLYGVMKGAKSLRWYQEELNKNVVWNYRDEVIENASEFYMPNDLLQKL